MCLGKPHVSFPSELAVRRIYCFVWSAESEGKLSAAEQALLFCVFQTSGGKRGASAERESRTTRGA